MDELTEALRDGGRRRRWSAAVTTFIEVILNQELGEPFRRDAMKKPVRGRRHRREDMQPQDVPRREGRPAGVDRARSRVLV